MKWQYNEYIEYTEYNHNTEFDANKFATSYVKNLSNASFLYEESIELLESLYKDYALLIVTNGLKDVQNRRIKKSIIAKYFKSIVISEEVNVSKPDPKIFKYALNCANNIDNQEILVIGDSLTSDIQGGINLGVDTCWYNPNKIENKTTISIVTFGSSISSTLTSFFSYHNAAFI